MNLNLILTPCEQAKLLERARSAGTTPERLVRRALEPILAGQAEPGGGEGRPAVPKLSLLGIWARYGAGPSEQEIDQNRAEMFSTLGREDIA